MGESGMKSGWKKGGPRQVARLCFLASASSACSLSVKDDDERMDCDLPCSLNRVWQGRDFEPAFRPHA
jgi:hypothetical protein